MPRKSESRPEPRPERQAATQEVPRDVSREEPQPVSSSAWEILPLDLEVLADGFAGILCLNLQSQLWQSEEVHRKAEERFREILNQAREIAEGRPEMQRLRDLQQAWAVANQTVRSREAELVELDQKREALIREHDAESPPSEELIQIQARIGAIEGLQEFAELQAAEAEKAATDYRKSIDGVISEVLRQVLIARRKEADGFIGTWREKLLEHLTPDILDLLAINCLLVRYLGQGVRPNQQEDRGTMERRNLERELTGEMYVY